MGSLDIDNIGTILFLVALLFVCVFMYELQPKEETPTVNTQESSQVKVKENTLNLNCTALENGEYLCKKSK